jgi:hypothetical protein
MWLWTAGSLAACGGDGVGPEGSAERRFLPAEFQILGEATGGDAEGRTASCFIELMAEVDQETHRGQDQVEYVITYGGGVGRSVQEPGGSGVSALADVVGPGGARLVGGDSVVLVLGDTTQTQSPFWRGIAVLAGSAHGGAVAGDWQCAPFDIESGDYVDTSLTVPGTWRIER